MKTIRKISFLLVVGLLPVLPLHAELIGLPIAETAALTDPGTLEFTPGAVMGNELSFYGIRQEFSFIDSFRCFLDLGAIDFEKDTMDFAGAFGSTICTPGDFICDLAMRPVFYYANTDTINVLGGSLSLVTSDETLLNDLHLYSAIGIDFSQTEEDLPSGGKEITTEINPLLSLGLMYNFTPSVGIFLEGSYVTTPLVGFGIKLR